MRCFLSFAFVLLISVVSGSSECSDYDFPCEDGGCVDSILWCDSHKDCSDGSDEKYCRKSNFKDPNKCPTNYFKCDNGPCIPMVGRCDGYKNCEDSSDEQNCEQRHSSSKSDGMSPPSVTVPLETRTTSATTSKTTNRTTTHQPRTKVESPTNFSDSPGAVQHSVEIMYSDSQHSDYSQQREEAQKWLLSQRRSDFGWGDETPRALTALYLSDLQRSIDKDESDMLMVKQLEVQLALDMSR
ncbi:hypothetical protein AVEN_205678-1 [Araneus ventricosus]|uniref:Uncharacterized protein n=1 Tax=Araneus ventricosus TaxID=182803 RepID=A0A4Y2WDA8_ARAVE|nr:hypothetical protein AVEN_205678-1 [Araneus ventricosus]